MLLKPNPYKALYVANMTNKLGENEVVRNESAHVKRDDTVTARQPN